MWKIIGLLLTTRAFEIMVYSLAHPLRNADGPAFIIVQYLTPDTPSSNINTKFCNITNISLNLSRSGVLIDSGTHDMSVLPPRNEDISIDVHISF